MFPQIVTAKELIEYLTDIVDECGDIPVITGSSTSGAFESVGRPAVLTVTPTEEMTDFQTYGYALPEDASQTKAAFIH